MVEGAGEGVATGRRKGRMEGRVVEQWSDREVQVGVLIRGKQAPLSPWPPSARTHTHTQQQQGAKH